MKHTDSTHAREAGLAQALPRRRLLQGAAAAALGPVLGSGLVAHAQAWPSKPLRVVVNFPPGVRPTNWRASSRNRWARRWARAWWWKTARVPTA